MHSALRGSVASAGPTPHPDGAPWPLAEAAAFLGVSLSTLERRVKDGSVPSFKLGGRRLVPDAELKRLAAGG